MGETRLAATSGRGDSPSVSHKAPDENGRRGPSTDLRADVSADLDVTSSAIYQ
jgi:hypothetical protein